MSTNPSSATVDIAASRDSAFSTADARASVGIDALAKYCQISWSSRPGSSRTSALSVARPARPICW